VRPLIIKLTINGVTLVKIKITYLGIAIFYAIGKALAFMII